MDVRTHQPQRTVSRGFPAGATRRATLRRLAGLAAVSGVPALAACATGGQGGGAGQASERLGANGYTFKQPVRLTYWKSLEGPRHDAQVKITDDFNASRSDVQVTLEHVGVYAQAAEKLTAVLAANTPPDVMMLTVDTFMPGFARLGALQPLDDYTKADKSARFETYVPGFIKNGTVNGKLYQLPLARSTPVLYFNKDHFRAAGLPETAPGTWDQLLDAAQKLTRAGVMGADSADGSKLAVPVAGYWWTFQAATWAFGGRLSDDKFVPTVTQNETVQAMQFLQDLVQRHRVARAYRTVGASSTAFQQGQLSFLVEFDRGVDADRGAHVRPRGRRVHADAEAARRARRWRRTLHHQQHPGGEEGGRLGVHEVLHLHAQHGVLLQDDRLHGGAHGRREEP